MNATAAISPLTTAELETITGGHGGMIDPNGNPGANGDEGPHIDPNG